MENEKHIERQKIISECFDIYPFMKDTDVSEFDYLESHEDFLEAWDFQLWVASNIRKAQTENLNDKEIEFLRENFNITVDINTLPEEELDKLHTKLMWIDVDESKKAEKLDYKVLWEDGETYSISERGDIASNIASYIGHQYREGGRRYVNSNRK